MTKRLVNARRCTATTDMALLRAIPPLPASWYSGVLGLVLQVECIYGNAERIHILACFSLKIKDSMVSTPGVIRDREQWSSACTTGPWRTVRSIPLSVAAQGTGRHGRGKGARSGHDARAPRLTSCTLGWKHHGVRRCAMQFCRDFPVTTRILSFQSLSLQGAFKLKTA